MALRRGFKSEAKSTAAEIRGELGVGPLEALDPWALAEYLGIPVDQLSALADVLPRETHHLRTVDTGAFSAVTVFRGARRTIVHNDGHAAGRQASDVTHELSHALLLHPATPALDDRGCRHWNEDVEDEADWLAGTLLIPEEAALWIVRSELSEADAAARFAVSTPMVRFRVNVTGARKRVARALKQR